MLSHFVLCFPNLKGESFLFREKRRVKEAVVSYRLCVTLSHGYTVVCSLMGHAKVSDVHVEILFDTRK